jgi:hypothetical protein
MRSTCTLRAALALVIAASASLAAPASSQSHSPSGTTSTTSSTKTFSNAAPASTPTVPFAKNDPNYPLWGPDSTIQPEPIRGQLGAKLLGPGNVAVELQNPDLLAPPSTDQGTV